MGHSFEHNRPDHQIINHNMPQGHAHLDQKYDKGMRSPIVSQFPADEGAGVASPEFEPGVGMGGHGSGGA